MEEGRQLAESASRDALTSVLNRRAIMTLAERVFVDAAKKDALVGIIMVDIDHFKSINDSLGHAAGDQALKEVTRRLTAALRQTDQLGRYGGEEFLIVIEDATEETISRTAERLRQAICCSPLDLGGEVRSVTASFGVAITAALARTMQDTIVAADRALYAAKNTAGTVSYSTASIRADIRHSVLTARKTCGPGLGPRHSGMEHGFRLAERARADREHPGHGRLRTIGI